MKEFLWVEKYRPQKIDDIVLPPVLKKTFREIIKSGELPNMIFAGTAGLGKTTVARALCKELELDHILINASEDGGIDVLRTKIKQYASTVSMGSNYKVVILDEADYLNPQSTQPALRGFIEEFSANCRFILTCNFKNRIIVPLHSRCSVHEFNTSKKEMAKLSMAFMKDRLIPILKEEGIKYAEKVLAELIIKHAPDWRRVINECQRYSPSGEITPDVLVGLSDQNLAQVMTYLRQKDFKSVRSWVTNNADLDSTVTFRALYDSMGDHVAPQSIPNAVLILAEYSYKSGFMADKELNLVACLTELMASLTWK